MKNSIINMDQTHSNDLMHWKCNIKLGLENNQII